MAAKSSGHHSSAMKPAEPTPVAPGPGRCHSTSRIPPAGSASAAALMAAAVPSPKVATWRARQAGATPVTPKLLRSARTTPSIAVPWLRKLSASIGVPAITPAASPCEVLVLEPPGAADDHHLDPGSVAAGGRPRRTCVDAAGRRVQVALARCEVGTRRRQRDVGRGLHGGAVHHGRSLHVRARDRVLLSEPRGDRLVIGALRELDAVVDERGRVPPMAPPAVWRARASRWRRTAPGA